MSKSTVSALCHTMYYINLLSHTFQGYGWNWSVVLFYGVNTVLTELIDLLFLWCSITSLYPDEPTTHLSTGMFQDDDDALSIPLRSTCYAPNLNQLQLEWCDCVSDSDLAEIAVVCRGSLHITDYYGIKVQPAIVVDTKHRWENVAHASFRLSNAQPPYLIN